VPPSACSERAVKSIDEAEVLAERTNNFRENYFEHRKLLHVNGVYYVSTVRPLLPGELDWWVAHFSEPSSD
jgi:hypothetical protein